MHSEAHKTEMARRRVRQLARKQDFTARILPASINRRTGKPHEHKREIARNLRRAPAA